MPTTLCVPEIKTSLGHFTVLGCLSLGPSVGLGEGSFLLGVVIKTFDTAFLVLENRECPKVFFFLREGQHKKLHVLGTS